MHKNLNIVCTVLWFCLRPKPLKAVKLEPFKLHLSAVLKDFILDKKCPRLDRIKNIFASL